MDIQTANLTVGTHVLRAEKDDRIREGSVGFDEINLTVWDGAVNSYANATLTALPPLDPAAMESTIVVPDSQILRHVKVTATV